MRDAQTGRISVANHCIKFVVDNSQHGVSSLFYTRQKTVQLQKVITIQILLQNTIEHAHLKCAQTIFYFLKNCFIALLHRLSKAKCCIK